MLSAEAKLIREDALMPTIEPALLADIPALVALLQALFAREREFTPNPDLQRQGLELILARPSSGQVFVARDGADVLGMVSLLFTVSTALGAPVCWLEDMVVRGDARGRGIGSRLVAQALAHAHGRGFARVTLLTDADNAGARRFYQRHGFAASDMVAMRWLSPVEAGFRS